MARAAYVDAAPAIADPTADVKLDHQGSEMTDGLTGTQLSRIARNVRIACKEALVATTQRKPHAPTPLVAASAVDRCLRPGECMRSSSQSSYLAHAPTRPRDVTRSSRMVSAREILMAPQRI